MCMLKTIALIAGVVLGTNAMSQTVTNSQTNEVITVGGGCFWCTEAVFEQLKGVETVESGYSGGTVPNPAYEQVSTGDTGHAEVSQITFDPSIVSLKVILEVFFTVHDPTTLDRQGNDVGTQYRSVIFYHSPEQKEAALASKEKLMQSGKYRRPIVTEVVPAATFWQAEDYHQQYLEKRGLSTCHVH